MGSAGAFMFLEHISFDIRGGTMKQQTTLQEFTRYVLLNVLGMIGLSCYILADTFFIANGLGSNGLTALNLAIPVYSFVHGSGLMLGMGGATKYSVFLGQKKRKEADYVFTNTVIVTIGLALVFVLLGLFGAKELTRLLGADAYVFDMTYTYLKVILLFAPAFMMNDVLVSFVRNDNNPKLAMIAMLAGSFSNIVLDYFFIFPCKLGIFGVVLATGFAPIISMLVLSRHRKQKERFRLQRYVRKGQTWRDVCSVRMTLSCMAIGVPSLITEVASGIVIIVFNMIILGLEGNLGVAAYGVIANISLVVVAVFTGIAQGMQPLVSKVYGVHEQDTMKQLRKYALITALCVAIVVYIVIYIGADAIALVFNSERNIELQDMAVQGLKLYFIATPFIGINVVLSNYFSAIEKPLPAQMISILRGMVLIIPMAFILAMIGGLTGVWLTVAVTEMIVCIFGMMIQVRKHKSRNKRPLE